MKRKKLTEADVTAESVFMLKRRQVLKMLGISATALSLPAAAQADLLDWFKGHDRPPAPAGKALDFAKPAEWQAKLTLTPEDKVSGYNNFYEFGLDKADPAANAGSLRTDPWTLTIGGEVAKPLTLDHDDLTKRFPLEERIYRMRCVEAWSMVVPWTGFPLKRLVELAKPTSNAKYLRFETFNRPEVAPGQQDGLFASYPWPYVDGLTMAEAMNDLPLMVTGAYGKPLPTSMGAPLRLHLPWKYGFKSIKGIVRVSFTAERPVSFWETLGPQEYGFWANVNPEVPHPRWSQASEEVLGAGERIPTLLYNGYGEQVAELYKGLENEKLFM